MLGEDHVGLIAAGRDHSDSEATVASIGTLLARGDRPPADLVILDEAHHAAAETFRQILEAYPSARIIGLTATPQRGDGRGLGCFDALHVVTTPRELEREGFLVPIEVIRPARQLKPGQIAQHPLDAYRAHADGRPCLVFASSVAHAETLAAEFSAADVPAVAIDGQTASTDRARAIDRFRRGAIDCLVNVAILTEGTDLPRASCTILARGCGTVGLYLQIAGRIARPAPGKRDAILIDLRGVSHVHGHPYQDREYSLDGRGIGRPAERADQSYCRVCGAPIEAGEECGDCGLGPAAAKPMKVTNSPLVKFAAVRRRNDSERADHYRRLLGMCRSKGWKTGRADHMYRGTYGDWPTAEVKRLARE